MDPIRKLAAQYRAFTPIPAIIRQELTAKEKKLVERFPCLIEFPIAWGDQDAFGHVNNIMYLRYFESGRAAYLAQMQQFGDGGDSSFVEYLQSNASRGVIVKNISCSYYSPVVYPDRLVVGVRISLASIKKDRFVMEFVVLSKAQQAAVAQGNGTIVTFDYKAQSKLDIPAEFMKAILKFEESAGNKPQSKL